MKLPSSALLRKSPLVLPLLALCACGNGQGRDAAVEDITSPPMDSPQANPDTLVQLPDGAVIQVDVPASDATGMDASLLPDGARADGSNASDVVNIPDDPVFTGLDVSTPEVSSADAGGPCYVQSVSVYGSETAMLARAVTVLGEAPGYTAASVVQRDGANNMWMHRSTAAGTVTASYNLSGATSGSDLSDGTLATDDMGYLALWSSAAAGGGDIFVRPANTSGVTTGAAINVSNDAEPSTEPAALSNGLGYVIAWRSGSSGLRTLWLDPAMGVHAGATVSEAAGAVAWRLVGTRSAGTYALVYLLGSAGSRRLVVQQLDNHGLTRGASSQVLTGDLDDGFAATVRAVDPGDGGSLQPAMVVVWGEPRSAPQLRARVLDLNTPGGPLDRAATTVDTGPGSAPGVALDGAGYVVAWRSSPSNNVVLTRMRADLTVMDRNVMAAGGAGLAIGVGAAATHPNVYGLGWADVLSTGTLSRLLIANCNPP